MYLIRHLIVIFLFAFFVKGQAAQQSCTMHTSDSFSILEEMNELEFHLAEEKKVSIVLEGALDASWIYFIAEIKKDGDAIILDDHSRWSIGWYWRSRVKEWDESDEIVLSYHYSTYFSNCMKFHNITKDSVAWGQLEILPKAGFSKFILKIDNHFSEVTLNDGSRYTSSFGPVFRNWKEGDLIMNCLVIDPPEKEKMDSMMIIINFFADEVAWSIVPVAE